MVEKTRHSPRTLPHSHRARSHTSRKSKISAGIPPAYKCPAENVEVPEERISRAHFNKLAEMLLDENNPSCRDTASLQRHLLAQIAYNDDFVKKTETPKQPSPMSWMSRVKSSLCKYLPARTRKWCLKRVHDKQERQKRYDDHVQEMKNQSAHLKKMESQKRVYDSRIRKE
jgi:hypothetical protein